MELIWTEAGLWSLYSGGVRIRDEDGGKKVWNGVHGDPLQLQAQQRSLVQHDEPRGIQPGSDLDCFLEFGGCSTTRILHKVAHEDLVADQSDIKGRRILAVREEFGIQAQGVIAESVFRVNKMMPSWGVGPGCKGKCRGFCFNCRRWSWKKDEED